MYFGEEHILTELKYGSIFYKPGMKIDPRKTYIFIRHIPEEIIEERRKFWDEIQGQEYHIEWILAMPIWLGAEFVNDWAGQNVTVVHLDSLFHLENYNNEL